LINGGVYLIRRSVFLQEAFPEKFSFEADYLARYLERHAIKGMLQEGYFIDIGVPEDYALAQVYFG
jgi:D-glycero-alpha-D-manno-heptose 1-phosphate guanylyltransferase